MGMPTLIQLTATASAIWWPDWMQTPFQVGIQAVTNTSGVNGTAIIEFSNESINYTSGDYLGTTTPQWFTIAALTGANASANWTTPCTMIRVSIVTATATSSWTVHFTQATFGR